MGATYSIALSPRRINVDQNPEPLRFQCGAEGDRSDGTWRVLLVPRGQGPGKPVKTAPQIRMGLSESQGTFSLEGLEAGRDYEAVLVKTVTGWISQGVTELARSAAATITSDAHEAKLELARRREALERARQEMEEAKKNLKRKERAVRKLKRDIREFGKEKKLEEEVDDVSSDATEFEREPEEKPGKRKRERGKVVVMVSHPGGSDEEDESERERDRVRPAKRMK
ncbi:hypothetical protein DFJ74DRAFT_258635 [Hyaloraphidium curvatum]|nr:hypothetical protein DFJ74DRAFT_258635 [Hyaloraphidium curvatum]